VNQSSSFKCSGLRQARWLSNMVLVRPGQSSPGISGLAVAGPANDQQMCTADCKGILTAAEPQAEPCMCSSCSHSSVSAVFRMLSVLVTLSSAKPSPWCDPHGPAQLCEGKALSNTTMRRARPMAIAKPNSMPRREPVIQMQPAHHEVTQMCLQNRGRWHESDLAVCRHAACFEDAHAACRLQNTECGLLCPPCTNYIRVTPHVMLKV